MLTTRPTALRWCSHMISSRLWSRLWCNENARVLKGGGKDGADSMRAEMMQEMEIFEGISQVDGVGDSEDEGGRNRLLLPGMLHHLPMMLSPGAQVRYCRVDECNVLFSSSPRAIAC